MNLLKYTLLFLALLISQRINAQFQNIMVSDSLWPNEPCIMINPENVAEIVAGANLSNYYISKDTGNTWQRGVLTSTYGVWGDPVIAVDTLGKFYYFHLSAPTGSSMAPDWLDRIVCQRLDNINGTWTSGTFMGLNGTKDQDKEWVAVDRKTNTMYVTWTQFDKYASSNSLDSSHILFSRSADEGNTWSPSVRINEKGGDCIDDDNTVEGAVPCVGPNGEVYVGWVGPDGIWFDRSLDGGNTWLDNDIYVSDMPGGWAFSIPGVSRAFGLPFTDCDISGGPHNGNIYMSWCDQRNGLANTDVWIVRSTDGGNNWSATVKVNDDPGISHQFYSSMSIDQSNGYIYVLFYDRRDYNDNRTDVYLAWSTDGGLTFQNRKISTSSFTPISTVFFGDYTYVSAHNGVIRPIWGRMDGPNSQSIWTAKVDAASLITSVPEANVKLELDNVYPNPFFETTVISFKLHEKATVDLTVIDLFGRTVATLVSNKTHEPGKYIYQFEASKYHVPAGMYYFRLRSGDVIKTRKIILAD